MLNVPHRLIPLLSDQPRSGDDLGRQLGVGRVTVHGLARRLSDAGMPLSVTRAGYAVLPGTPVPALVPVQGQFGRALRYLPQTTSTQDALRGWAADAQAPAPHGAVVVAERQTAGRGRRGRSWLTGEGHLAFSVLLQGPLPLATLPTLPLAAGLAVQQAVGGGRLKWPNDLLDAQGGKVAGILLEADLRGEEARQVILGVGLNVTQAPPGAGAAAQWRPDVTRAALLGDVLAALEDWLPRPPAEVVQAWRERSGTLGAAITLSGPGGPGDILAGTAADLDEQGSLLVRDAAGHLHRVSAGDVQLVGELPPVGPPDPQGPGPR